MRQAGAMVMIIGRPRLYALVGFAQLIRYLRHEKPDMVHTLLPWGDLIGRTCTRLAGIRRIVSTVTARYLDKPRCQFWLDRATVGWARRVAFQSSEIVNFSITHEGVRPDQVCCIPNGVDLDSVDRKEAAASLRQQFGNGAKVIIGMVARLHPQKAQGDLLHAYKKALVRYPDTCLWLVGDGPEQERLTLLTRQLGLEGRVLFAGDRDNARDWIAAMDLFVHPTHFEGLPLAVLEAMAAAKPVIATEVDGLQDLIKSGVHGWLVPPGDPSTLAQAIIHVLDHPEEAIRVGRAASERVRKEFHSERMVNDYYELFISVISDSPR